jgi:transposase
MKYTKEERLDIGRKIYDGEISRYEAAELYGINDQTARNYMRLYRDDNQLPPKRGKRALPAPSCKDHRADMEELESMTKEQLIQELIKARITEARLKKGYEVKGDGTVILYGNRNTK